MDTRTATTASTASSAAGYASLPTATQQDAQPVVGIRPWQASFLPPPAPGLPACADNAPHFTQFPAPLSPRSLFCAAACRGDAGAVDFMIRTGQGNLNTIDPATGMTVLMLAAMHGHEQIVLLLCGGDSLDGLDRTDAQGNSALTLSAGAGHVGVVRRLVELGAAVDQEDAHGITALMQFSARSETGMMQWLIDAGADPAHVDHAGQTAADLAAAQGNHFAAAILSGSERSAVSHSCTSSTCHPSRTSAVPEAFQASNTDPLTEDVTRSLLQVAIEENDPDALKQVLGNYRQSGCDVAQLLCHVGKLDTSDVFFADLMGTPLMAAAHHGHAALFPVLLAAGAKIDQSLPDGTTALHVAVMQNCVPAVRALVALGAEDKPDADGDTALIFAASHGNPALVHFLLEAGVDKDHKNNDGDTALIEAAWRGHYLAVQALLRAKARPNLRNKDGMSALMLAASNGQAAIVRLLFQAGARFDQADGEGTTALMYAAAQGHGDIVDMLLAKGANAHTLDKQGLTALVLANGRGQAAVRSALTHHLAKSAAPAPNAASKGLLSDRPQASLAALMEIIERNDMPSFERVLAGWRSTGRDVAEELDQFCLQTNANTPLLNGRTMTPLMLSSCLGCEDMLARLIKAGANVNLGCRDGNSPLLLALLHAHEGCVETLRWAGARIEHVNAKGWTSLMIAAMRGDTGAVLVLLGAGAYVDAAGDDEKTALHFAAQFGQLPALQALIDAGAAVNNLRSGKKPTPLMRAAGGGHTALVQTLLDAGADPNLKTYGDRKAVDFAKDAGHGDIVKLLRAAGKKARQPKNLLRKHFG